MPPDAWDVSRILWPASIVGEDGLGAPPTSVELTVMVLPTEHCDAGEFAESDTL